ncbi:MAG: chitobiase/beta-hexosaminidase C-terminal domain-containing protein [Parasporobacterium sp.]|nr:chitobiase/beta-hexosaminidase C-terminal domain-containing protein [Parasporobacterium sp.]
MRCRECGLEVDNDRAFCPVCGAPMKVTADYEYIQAEIANKVDRFFNDENPQQDYEPADPDEIYEEEDGTDDPDYDDYGRNGESMAKTRNIYGSDSIFADDLYDSDDYDPEEPYEEEERERSAGRRRENARPVRRRLYKKKDQTTARIITVLIIFVIIVAAAVGVMAILGVFNNNQENQTGVDSVQNQPTLSSSLTAGETYEAPVTVTLSSQIQGNIFYTLDGTEPNFNSRIYSGPFEVAAMDVPNTYPNVHFRAASYDENSEKTGEINMEFFLEYNEADAARIAEVVTTTVPEPVTTAEVVLSAPSVTPISGEYSSDTDIVVSSPEGAAIYYTYDGTVPNSGSAMYTGPVKMRPGTGTFSAMCIKDGVSSMVTSNTYTLEYNYWVSSSEALNSVRDELLWDGFIIDYDLYTNDGYAQLSHEGVYDIGGYTYYIIRVDFYTSNGAFDHSIYRGVGVNYGGVYGIDVDNSNYYVTW